jgi:rare lipoprotein A (peptidoglycan hydrolase)
MRMTLNKKALLAPIAMVAWATIPMGALAQGTASLGGSSARRGTPGDSRHAKTKIHTTGIATWFGPGFYGNTTACGQTLTPEVVGVANRTLPCGTLVRVGYQGRTLTIPVLDRGPYSHIGADWDLTAGAASALKMTDVARISTRIVGDVPNTPELGAPAPSVTAARVGGAAAG